MPVIVAVVFDATEIVLIVNEADVAPAGIVTFAGTVALELEELRVTTDPPGPAGPLRVAVPVADVPPTTDVGATTRLVSAGVATVRLAVWLVFPSVPVIVKDIRVETGTVVTVNVTEEAPEGTVTLAGTVALGLFDERLTIVPEDAAGPVRVTVPVDEVPPTTKVGVTVTVERVAGLIVS